MFEIFEKSILGLKKNVDIKNFINDLLTPAEKNMLAKRLAISILRAKGYDYRTISKLLKVSSSTILSVIRKQAIDGRGYQAVVAQNSPRIEKTLGFPKKI